MKTYEVTVPIAGVAYVIVEVEDSANEDEIWEAACDELGDVNIPYPVEAIDFYKHFQKGNVSYVDTPTHWSFEEEECDDDDD